MAEIWLLQRLRFATAAASWLIAAVQIRGILDGACLGSGRPLCWPWAVWEQVSVSRTKIGDVWLEFANLKCELSIFKFEI
jgi:hypothetical protein